MLKHFLDGGETFSKEKGLKQLRQLAYLFLEEVAEHANPILNQLAQKKPSSTLSDKKELSKWINAQALNLGLGVRCEKTGKPGFFVGNGSDNSEIGRFQLVLSEDGSQRPLTSVRLPEFSLIPRLERVGPDRSWSAKVKDSEKSSGRVR